MRRDNPGRTDHSRRERSSCAGSIWRSCITTARMTSGYCVSRCRESREHRHHAAALLEKAAQPYRAKFQSYKQGRAAVFAQGHQFLRERGQCLLEWLEGTERQLTGGRNSHLAKGSAEVIRLETLISELEKKARQPALELLQDPSDITSRYPQKKFWIEKPVSPAIRKRMEEFSDKCLCLGKGLRGFHGKLMRDLEYKTMRSILNSRPANGYLAVSPDGKSMVFTGLWLNKCQRGQQFDLEPGVLGSKGFTWGRVYWEVKVDRIWWEAEEEEETMRYRVGSRGVFGSNNLGGFTGITDGYHSPGYREENEELEEERSQENRIWPKFCLVGVARESVVRRGFLNFTPEEGSGLCSCPQLGCLYAAARGPSRSCPTAPGRLELLWIMMVGR
ncbi:tripartite motif-containing protein 26-like [Ovis aries]|uniref:tripartite motif-containing protein 26-like n=1 Tax=Ovis aries TaxID=9940 RepID=UPI001C2EAF1D|nr:tripartite motif-containing protein 26-like [Ovis aries]XP_060259327.1 tripartite motif-containing protein 26-like [Ovis aries]XP_060259328.1 tripartite motif-containing protein 26-like [Ovis aries]